MVFFPAVRRNTFSGGSNVQIVSTRLLFFMLDQLMSHLVDEVNYAADGLLQSLGARIFAKTAIE